MFSISYAADEHYRSALAGAPVYENAKQIIAAPRRLVSLYALNNSAGDVYLKVQDSANAGADNGPCTVYPVAAGSFISVATHGGDRMFNGIYVKAYTDAACTVAAGNVMHYKLDWTAAV